MEKNIAQFKVIKNGPLQVSGNFTLSDSEGKLITRQGPLFLCRCGKSSDKPFCDGSHKKQGVNL